MPSFALLFPGQGSQHVGMGRDLCATSKAARLVVERADRAWQGGLTSLIFEGTADRLTDTSNAQPAILAVSLACYAALVEALGREPQAELLAGHSLGEYTAMVVARTLTLEAGLRLVGERGQAMKAAGQAQPGTMAAVLGLDLETVDALCQEAQAQCGQVVVVANDNGPGQIVISGAPQAVGVACELARARGAKRVVPLAVSIASHSPLMEPARARFRKALQEAPLSAPGIAVVGNGSARPMTTSAQVLEELEQQLVTPVRWTATIQHMVERGIAVFVEVGPKDVLTGLGRRIAPQATFVPCGTMAEVSQAAELLQAQSV